MNKKILEIRNLRVSFKISNVIVEILSDINISIPEGKIVAVVGESGCGKTLTALSVMGLLPIPPAFVNGGEVIFDDVNLLELNEEQLREYRGDRISMIFQEPVSSLNPVFTVGDQIGEAIRAHNQISKEDERKKVLELLDLVGIPAPEERYNSYPHELSGGMCQRVMIAMALSCNPELLIADEPTTAVDVTIQAGILELILRLKDKFNMAVMLITHDLGIVSEIADYVYVLYAGKVVEYGTVNQIFDSPSHPYTIGLIESIPSIHKKAEILKSIPGFIPNPLEFPKGCRFQDRCGFVIDKCKELVPDFINLENGHNSACFRAEEVNKKS